MKIVKNIRRGIASLRNNYLAVTSIVILQIVILVVYWRDFRAPAIESTISHLLRDSNHASSVGSTILFAVFVRTVQYTRKWRRKASNLKISEELSSPRERLLYATIRELKQKTKENDDSKHRFCS